VMMGRDIWLVVSRSGHRNGQEQLTRRRKKA
jgi:hypothetical protein